MEEYLEFEEEASRSELIIRIFYSIPISIILGIYGILAGICQCLLWLGILILGRRVQSLNDVVRDYIAYNIQVISYMNVLTDERPGITPRDIRVFLEKYE